MATQDAKRKAMDAVSHRETAAHIRIIRGSRRPASPPASTPLPRGSVLADVKRQAMNAVSHVETVTQIGWLKAAGGIAAYIGKIREADREMQARQRDSRLPQRTTRREDFERL